MEERSFTSFDGILCSKPELLDWLDLLNGPNWLQDSEVKHTVGIWRSFRLVNAECYIYYDWNRINRIRIFQKVKSEI